MTAPSAPTSHDIMPASPSLEGFDCRTLHGLSRRGEFELLAYEARLSILRKSNVYFAGPANRRRASSTLNLRSRDRPLVFRLPIGFETLGGLIGLGSLISDDVA